MTESNRKLAVISTFIILNVMLTGLATLVEAQQGKAAAQTNSIQGPPSVQEPAGNSKSEGGSKESAGKGKTKETIYDKCYQSRPLFGDLAPLGLENWSVGTTIATSVVRYDFSSKKAALATGAGAGIAIRYYGRTYLGSRDEAERDGFDQKKRESITKHYGSGYVSDAKDEVYLPLSSIKPECRASTADIGKERTDKLASSIFSITPIVYYSKQTTENDLNIQPALMIGLLDDIISIGTGFNLTGQEKGKMFLLMSLGYGFKF